MSTRFDIDSYNESKCSICGKPSWTGSWRGEKLILICYNCTVHHLPALIADATWSPQWTPAVGERDLVKIEAAFWHAQKLNIQRNPKGKGGLNV